MIKIRVLIILSICSIIFCVGLTGCVSNKDKADIYENQPSETTNINEISSSDKSQSPTDVVQTETIDSSSKENRDIIDYTQYLKKIWVVKSWNGGAYYYSSFFISKIENGVLEGRFSTRSVAEPDFHFYSLDPSKYLGDLSGTVNNSIAECHFSDKVGNKGNVTLVFKENNEIEATIEYTDKRQIYKDLYLDGTFIFRPYNLVDIENFTRLEDHSFVVDLNSWGSVNFVSGEINAGDRTHPGAYLTNEYDDILYEFNVAFKTGSEIIEAQIKDINNDGLKDVMIITSFVNDSEAEHIKFIFFQMDGGLFYSADLDAR